MEVLFDVKLDGSRPTYRITTYERYDTDVFTEPIIKDKLGVNAIKANKHLYDDIVYDSTNERDFATDLNTNIDVAVYVKLPDGFYISIPVGHYDPRLDDCLLWG